MGKSVHNRIDDASLDQKVFGFCWPDHMRWKPVAVTQTLKSSIRRHKVSGKLDRKDDEKKTSSAKVGDQIPFLFGDACLEDITNRLEAVLVDIEAARLQDWRPADLQYAALYLRAALETLGRSNS